MIRYKICLLNLLDDGTRDSIAHVCGVTKDRVGRVALEMLNSWRLSGVKNNSLRMDITPEDDHAKP